jgi:ABC-type uncharacterized transport system permease subunit
MGLLVAVITGIIMSLVHAVATITYRVNQIVSGVAINIMAVGIGRFLSQSVFGQETQSELNPYLFPTILGINGFAFALIPITALSWFVLYRTRFGLRLRSVGENPEAADTLGINVYLMRYAGVILSGFIALAAMIFGRWNPVGAVLAALLFGYADTFRIMFETKIPIPSQFVQMLPYVLAIVVLVGMMGKARPPAADGIPYEPGE